MAVYIYDGSFEGFLSCVYCHYYNEKADHIYNKESYLENFAEKPIQVISNNEKAEKVYKAIEDKISKNDLKRIYRVFKSGEEGKEMALMKYIVLGFEMGSKVSMNHANPAVRRVEMIHHKVSREIDRMLGLVRFSSVGENILYSSIKTDHDILEFIASHFATRLKEEKFIIHDEHRKKAVICQNGRWYLTESKQLGAIPEINNNEADIRLLWKSYFKALSIKERRNARCQKNMMPLRYWDKLTEMQ